MARHGNKLTGGSAQRPKISLTMMSILLSVALLASSTAFAPNPTTTITRTTATAQLFALSTPGTVTVALTREDGKNDKLRSAIDSNDKLSSKVNLLEIPCIQHADGPDFDSLARVLQEELWDYVVVTSPEAARVLASAWDENLISKKQVVPKVAAVGKATADVLEEANITVSFFPSKAIATTLAAELELKNDESRPTTVLYPASARAKQTLQNGLSSRGFKVTRLDTYDTVTAEWTEEQKNAAKTVQVACFASPSSIKGWLANTDNNNQVVAACIGETSAQACREQGWTEDKIKYPQSPGLEGWAEAIEESIDSLQVIQ